MNQWNKYNYINTIELIQQVDKYLMTNNKPNFKVKSFDTETNGLALYKTTVIGFSFSVNSQQGFYVPLMEWVPDKESLKKRTINKVKYDVYEEGQFRCVWTGAFYEEFVKPADYNMPEIIPAIIQRWFGEVNLIMHNAPFDVNHTFINTGVDLKEQVLLDTALLSHVINENTPNGLKPTAEEWKEELGINPHQMANQEQQELSLSVVRNGGGMTKGGKPRKIWRAEPEYQCKYACADTFLTFGLYEVGLTKFVERFGADKLSWLFEDEIMPVCKEVVIPMKRRGVYIDVEHFTKAEVETHQKIKDLEDELIIILEPYLKDFTIGKSLDEAISNQRLVKRLIQLEGLKMPTKYDKKAKVDKETLAKGVVKKLYQEDPHWIWGYIIGEDEIKYSDEKLLAIKKKLYEEVEGRRYRFNVGSDAHLRWLFCDVFKYSKTDLPQTDSATKDNPIPSMAAAVLQEFMLEKYPWVKTLLTFKKLKKLHSTYIRPAVELNIDGWLYMDMRQNGTKSGRFACSGGFNLQTLPRIDDELEALSNCGSCKSSNISVDQEIGALAHTKCNDCGHEQREIICSSIVKVGFIAPPGMKIVNADYSSLEPRCFAFVSGDVKLKEVYWNNLDLYSKVYCDMFDDENKYSADPKADNFLKKVNKAARTDIKPIVLGIPYGANKYQVAQLTGRYKTVIKDGKETKFPDAEYGQWVIDKYLGTYPELNKYMTKMELDCLQKGFVETLIGRRRHFTYAPKIYRFLVMNRIKVEEIVEATTNQLKKPNVKFITKLGNTVNFKEEQLKSLIHDMGLPWKNCCEKGFWLYVKNLLKADLNNAKNHPIQGLAASITNRGMLDTTRRFRQKGMVESQAWVMLQIHDEVMCYVREDLAEAGVECLQKGMEDNIYTDRLDVAMIAEPLICDNIKDAK